MISSKEIFSAKCDKCGKLFSQVDNNEFTNQSEIISALIQEGWLLERKMHIVKCTCDECLQIK